MWSTLPHKAAKRKSPEIVGESSGLSRNHRRSPQAAAPLTCLRTSTASTMHRPTTSTSLIATCAGTITHVLQIPRSSQRWPRPLASNAAGSCLLWGHHSPAAALRLPPSSATTQTFELATAVGSLMFANCTCSAVSCTSGKCRLTEVRGSVLRSTSTSGARPQASPQGCQNFPEPAVASKSECTVVVGVYVVVVVAWCTL